MASIRARLSVSPTTPRPPTASVLTFKQAAAKARIKLAAPAAATGEKLTVRKAMELYTAHKTHAGQPTGDLISRTNVHILPHLADRIVADLKAADLRAWHADVAATPKRTRTRAGVPQFKAAPETDEQIRARRASANKVLSMLRAALNFCYAEGLCESKDAWSIKLRPFRGVDRARGRYLSVAEAQRLVNACDPDFRPMVVAALQTGCRYSELCRLTVADFHVDSGTLQIQKSKSGLSRYVTLTEEGIAFFREHTAGRTGSDPILKKANGTSWNTSDQADPMREAVARARIEPRILFHGLRHSWASLAVMGGVPLMVVARNLGHTTTAMVEKHYGHLAPSYITDEIRKGAPKFGFVPEKRVEPLR